MTTPHRSPLPGAFALAFALHLGVHTSQAGITDQLVLHLPLDGALTDASGRGNNGTAVGNVVFVPGVVGSGAAQLSFSKDGSNFNHITLGSPADLNFGSATDFSVSFWVRFKSWVFDPPFIGNKDWLSGQYQGWLIGTGTDGRLQWNYGGPPGQRKDYDGPAGTTSDGQWHHVLVTFLRAGEVVTYLDGISVDERDVSASLNNVDTPPGFATNIGQDGTGRYTDGNSVQIDDLAMDDLGIWRRALTSTEARAIREAGLAGRSLDTVVSTPEPPVLVRQPTDQAVVAGDALVLRVLPRGSSPFAFQWTRGGNVLAGETNALLALSDVQAANAGIYRCLITNVAGSLTSNPAELTVDTTQPPTLRSQPLGLATAVGARFTLTVGAAGVAPLAYQWSKDGTEIPDATTASYTVSRAAKADAGVYTVRVRGANGQAVISNPAVVSVVTDIRQGLVAHLTFDADFLDASGRGNHGQAVGNPSLVDGLIGGKALRFSQKSGGTEFNYVTLGKPSDLEFSVDADFSFSCWVKFSSWQRDPLFISNKNWNSGGNVGFALATGADGRFQWNYAEQVGERRDFDSRGALISDGRWHHLAVSFQRGGEAVTLVDGVEVNRQPLPTTGTTISPGLPMNIGQDGTGTYTDSGGVQIEDGTIDDVAIWRRAITTDEMRSIHRKGLVGANVVERALDDQLVAYLPFDGDFWDRSGRGNHGTPIGSPSFQTGMIGQAASVSSLTNGSSFHYVSLGAPADLDFGRGTHFTVSFWTRLTNWTGDPVFLGNKNWSSGGNQGWVIATAGNGRLQWNLGDGDAGGRTRKDYDGPAGTLGNGAWHHVAIAFERTGSARTYLDGALVDTSPIAADLDSIGTASGLALNIGQDGVGAYIDNGAVGNRGTLIDDLAIWRRVLDGTELAAIHQRGVQGADLFGRRAVTNTLPNGVAAGDPTTNSIVLWARSTAAGEVRFEIGQSPDFSGEVIRAAKPATDSLVPVKVTVGGLTSGTRYHYRVTDAAGSIGFGTFRTLAKSDSVMTVPLRFGVSGDERGELAPFPSIANVSSRNLDFFVNLGDTIYADYASPAVPLAQARTLEEYRRKHDEIHSARLGVNHFSTLRSSTVYFATIDDHEVANDFAGGAPAGSDPRFDKRGTYLNDSELFQNGLRAFEEFTPLASEVYSAPGDARTDGKPKLYRSRRFGRSAAMFLIDARTFRDASLASPANPTDPIQVAAFLAQSFDIDPRTGQPLARRTMLGRTQLDLLKADLLAAQRDGVGWKFILVPEPIQNLGVLAAGDRFEGYAAERTELLSFISTNRIRDCVFVCADIHGTLVNNLTYQMGPGMPQIQTSAFEISTGPVAFDAPFGPTVLNLAAEVPAGSQSLLDVFLATLGLPNRAAFDALLTPAQKNSAIAALVDNQVVPLGYSPLGFADSSLDVIWETGAPVATFTYGWTEFEITPDTGRLAVTTYGIPAYGTSAIGPDLLLQTPKVMNRFTVGPERPVLTLRRSGSGLEVSWDAGFEGYRLQSSQALGGEGAWIEVASDLKEGRRTAPIAANLGNARFFRLIRP